MNKVYENINEEMLGRVKDIKELINNRLQNTNIEYYYVIYKELKDELEQFDDDDIVCITNNGMGWTFKSWNEKDISYV